MKHLRKTKRLILGITGIRSEYGILSAVLEEIEKRSDLELQLIVTGAHLSPAYGRTVDEVRDDGFAIADEVESLINGDADSSRVKGLAVQLQGMVQTVARVKPDLLLVLGDREEAMAGALLGTYMNIPVAHIAGGDRVIGNADDQIRHAVTKLAHVHFPTNMESARRILRLGEQNFRVFNAGHPGLDLFVRAPRLTAGQLSERLGFEVRDREPFILLVQHPLSSEIAAAYVQMKRTLRAVELLGIKTVMSYPNSDAGSQEMVRAIEEFRHLPFLHIAKNIRHPEFINLMRRASCLLGNSSAGIMEAPLLKLPVVNVGNRQKGRLHAENVSFVPHDPMKIAAAVRRALHDKSYRAKVARCSNPYGEGRASKRIAEVLAKIPLDEKLRIKDISY